MRPGIRALSGLLSRFTSLCRAICREVSDPLMRRVRALEPRMARLWDAIKALKAYIAQLCRRKRIGLRRKERIGDSGQALHGPTAREKMGKLQPLSGVCFSRGGCII